MLCLNINSRTIWHILIIDWNAYLDEFWYKCHFMFYLNLFSDSFVWDNVKLKTSFDEIPDFNFGLGRVCVIVQALILYIAIPFYYIYQQHTLKYSKYINDICPFVLVFLLLIHTLKTQSKFQCKCTWIHNNATIS